MAHGKEREGSPAWSADDLASDPHAMQDKAERVRRMFEAIAPRYDLNNRLHSFGQDSRWRRVAVRMVAPRESDRALDVACGTGDLSECLADAGVAEVIGVDFTEAMLELARARAELRVGRGRVRYAHADAQALPFPDARFDIVTIAFGLRNVANPSKALSEFRRVLRPGGRLVILEFAQPRCGIVRALNNFYTRQVMPRTAAWIAGDREGAYAYLPRSIETFLTPERLAQELAALGFAAPVQRRLTFGVCVVTVAAVPGVSSGADGL